MQTRIWRTVRQDCLQRSFGANRRYQSTSPIFRVSEEVQQALSEQRPVVALESAVYTHGFPYPENIALASLLESSVRTTGAVPATIGILDGVARVGLDAEELIRLAGSTGHEGTIKVSRRDLAFATALGSPGRRLNGGTTVAGTMVLAHMAGIKVFATGGLGGVHRGAESSMDISADLTELGRTPVAVVSSGCKSFLDIPRTVEYLETEGVPVATFADGREGKVDFPGFWSRESGTRSPMTIQSEAEAAAIIDAQHRLGLNTGLCFGNPIPEPISIPWAELDEAIKQAVQEANAAGATGNANTPFILNKIKEITGAKSVESNRGLLAANARRGALVAIELAKIWDTTGRQSAQHFMPDSAVMVGPGATNYTKQGLSKGISAPSGHASPLATQVAADEPKGTDADGPVVLVAGGLAVDSACDFKLQHTASGNGPILHTSNPATILQTIGGVGHNVARAIHYLGTPVRLCSLVGDDLAGSSAKSALQTANMDVTGIDTLTGERTSQYVAVNAANKDLVVAMADMSIMENFRGETAPQMAFKSARPGHLAVDTNWSPSGLSSWLRSAKEAGAMTFVEPVSIAKAARVFNAGGEELPAYPEHTIDVITPNMHELTSLNQTARELGHFERHDWWQVIDSLGLPSSGPTTRLSMATNPDMVASGIPQQIIQLLPFMPTILTKLGSQGVLVAQIIPEGDARLTSGDYAPHIISRCNNEGDEARKVGGLYMRLFPASEPVPSEQIVSVNGVGDTFLGALVAGLAHDPSRKIEHLVHLAQRAAVLTLKSRESVSPRLAELDLANISQP